MEIVSKFSWEVPNMSTLTQHLETSTIELKKFLNFIKSKPKTDVGEKLIPALTFFIGVGEKLASPGEIERIAKIIEDKIWERHPNCEYSPSQYVECPAECCYKNAAHSLLGFLTQPQSGSTELTQEGKQEEGGGK